MLIARGHNDWAGKRGLKAPTLLYPSTPLLSRAAWQTWWRRREGSECCSWWRWWSCPRPASALWEGHGDRAHSCSGHFIPYCYYILVCVRVCESYILLSSSTGHHPRISHQPLVSFGALRQTPVIAPVLLQWTQFTFIFCQWARCGCANIEPHSKLSAELC